MTSEKGEGRGLDEEKGGIALSPPSSLLAEQLAGSSGGSEGMTRIAGGARRGTREPPKSPSLMTQKIDDNVCCGGVVNLILFQY